MLKQGIKFCTKIISQFIQEGGVLQAAGLSYISLLSLVPLITLSLTVLSAFPIFAGLADKIQQFIFSNFVTSSAQAIQQHLQAFVAQTTKLSLSGTLSLLITAVLMIFSMEQAFNRIWKVQKKRNAIQAFLMYWAVLTLTPILAGIGFMLSSYLMAFPFISDAAIPAIRQIIFTVFPYILTFLVLTLLYMAIPNCKVKLKYAAIGAIIATILFELAKYSFTLYIVHFPTYRLLYGALATIPIFLVWLYLSWLIVLFGSFVSYVISNT